MTCVAKYSRICPSWVQIRRRSFERRYRTVVDTWHLPHLHPILSHMHSPAFLVKSFTGNLLSTRPGTRHLTLIGYAASHGRVERIGHDMLNDPRCRLSRMRQFDLDNKPIVALILKKSFQVQNFPRLRARDGCHRSVTVFPQHTGRWRWWRLHV